MDENNVNNQEGNVYVVGTRGYSAYEVAVQNGFEGTVDEWLESLIGPQGPEGPEGPQGNPGPTGLTPSIRVGSVTTGDPNTNVEISITGTPEVAIINFKIPKGAKGDKGDKGDPGSEPDLSEYVKKTDYATDTDAGVVKSGNGAYMSSSKALAAVAYSYQNYLTKNNNTFISKGTLENVLTEKIGDISSLLDTINGEVI